MTSGEPAQRPLTATSPGRAGARACTSGIVREGGVEPPRPFGHTDLNRARLPIPPLALEADVRLSHVVSASQTGHDRDRSARYHRENARIGAPGSRRGDTSRGGTMSALQRFENRLEQMISGVFACTFRSAVQPVEVASALNREVDNSAQILSRDRRLVPNDFHVELSESDHQRLEGLGPQLTRELTEMLREHAAEQSYVFTGPVSISLEVSDDLTTGRFRVRSKAIASSSLAGGDPSDTQVRRATATLELNGERLPLAPPGIVIGRGNEADLRIDDPGVSRKHIEIRVEEPQEGGEPRITVHDLGSTNGMSVNGKRVEKATLADGATIRIGNTTMSLHL